jgi:hypothetical protein
MGFIEKVGNFFPTKIQTNLRKNSGGHPRNKKQEVKTAQRANDGIIVAK